jgi:hypothetical protein
MRRKNLNQNFPRKRFLLGKGPRLEAEVKITKLSLTLRLILLKQNELLKNQKCNLRSDLKEKIALIKQINRLLRGIKLLRKPNFYSLSDKSQTNEVLLESAFRRLLLLLFLFLLLPFASDISSAWQMWQLLQQLLQLLFGSGPG